MLIPSGSLLPFLIYRMQFVRIYHCTNVLWDMKTTLVHFGWLMIMNLWRDDIYQEVVQENMIHHHHQQHRISPTTTFLAIYQHSKHWIAFQTIFFIFFYFVKFIWKKKKKKTVNPGAKTNQFFLLNIYFAFCAFIFSRVKKIGGGGG